MKLIALKKRIKSGFLSGLMLVTTIMTSVLPVTVKASDVVYTLEGIGAAISYTDAFDTIDDNMRNYSTNTFDVIDSDGSHYTAICANPSSNNPLSGRTFGNVNEYGKDTIAARVMFFTIGSGGNEGPLSDYSSDVRTIIVHHAISKVMGDDKWNEYNGSPILKDENILALTLVDEVIEYAENHDTGYYDATMVYLINDNGLEQNLALYKESYNPPPAVLTGHIRFLKKSAMPSISDNNSCYSLAGAEITVYSNPECTDIITTLTTGNDGYTGLYDIDYTEGSSTIVWFKETKAPKGFLLNEQIGSIEINSETTYTETITDIPGNDPISLVLSKKTADGHGAGEARLEGAEYTVKYYETISDTDPALSGSIAKYTWVFKTDGNGRIRLRPEYLVSGSDGLLMNISGSYTLPLGTITIQETKAPEGYLLNDTVYVAKTDIVNGTVRTTNLPTDEKAAQETPYEGTISIQKFLGGHNELKSPEPDAEFQIYLKAAGSYSAAPEESRQTITTDEYGFAMTKKLPYGTYTVHQTKGNNKYYFISDIDVEIKENDANYHKILENVPIEYYIKIVKRDAHTGNIVELAGTTFEIYDENGTKVSLKTMTPSGIKTIDSFTTNENGYVYTLEKILKGDYTLIETKAPDGYVLDNTPVCFTVSDDTYVTEDGVGVVIVEKKDEAVKGSITVTKVGEVLDAWDATEADKNNHFVYKKVNIPDATFTLAAKEDILSPDNGRVIYAAGETVITLTTGADGTITADNLYLGTYELIETTAPDGYVLDNTPIEVKLLYAGETVDIVKNTKTVENERQKIVIEVNKSDAATFTPLKSTMFALYAVEDIVNHDGTVIIKKGSMIEKQSTNALGKAIFVSDLPLGQYYVKEIDSPTGYGNRFEIKRINAAYKGQALCTQIYSYNFEDDATEIVRTTAADVISGNHQGVLQEDKKVTVVDHVECKNLSPGKNYLIKGTIMNRATGEPVIDMYGNVVTESVTFAAAQVNQTVDVTFNFEADLSGTTIVVFEDLIQDGINIFSHNDLTDENQTIAYPEIHTTATIENVHSITAKGEVLLTDKVEYKNLIPGNKYTINGVLYNQDNGKKLLDKNGNAIIANKEFIAKTTDGSIDVIFTFDSSILEGTQIVVFEDLYKSGIKIATHSDLNDKNQTVEIVKTGDSRYITWQLFIMMISAFILFISAFRIRKRR